MTSQYGGSVDFDVLVKCYVNAQCRGLGILFSKLIEKSQSLWILVGKAADQAKAT